MLNIYENWCYRGDVAPLATLVESDQFSLTYEKRVMVWNFGIMTYRTYWFRIIRIVVVEKVREPIGGVILDLSIGNLAARATL